MSAFKQPNAWEFLGTRLATAEDIAYYDMLQSHLGTDKLERPEFTVGDKLAKFGSQRDAHEAATRTLTGAEVRSYFQAATENSKGYQIPALKQAAQALGLDLNMA